MPSDRATSVVEYCCVYLILLIVFKNFNKPAVTPFIEGGGNDDTMTQVDNEGAHQRGPDCGHDED